MRKLNKKGFTLVEIVIVIVIIAILAAMLIPALTQWINKSKAKTFISACGTIKTAVWSQVAENYAVNGDTETVDWNVVTQDVGKDVSAGNTYVNGAGYAVSFNYAAGSMTVYDSTFQGVWSGNTATSWNVTKKS